MNARPALSVVIPVFNEREVFPELLARLDTALPALGVPFEVVFVDDGSRDETPSLIAAACRTRPWARGLVLSRNFGHQIAVTAGLRHARGEAVAVLDGDLQDPPELLGEMRAKLAEGYEVVYAVRRDRKEGLLKRAAYAAFYRLLRALATVPIPLDSGDFCVMSARAVSLVNAMPERHRFVRGLRSWIGFRQTGFEYGRAARAGGRPQYTFSKLVRLALDGIFTFSEQPLRWSMWFGAAIAAGAFAWAAFVVLWRLLADPHSVIPGWATLTAGMFFLGGVQLVSVGILGEYVGRIHTEVKGRPLFVVAERHNLEAPAE